MSVDPENSRNLTDGRDGLGRFTSAGNTGRPRGSRNKIAHETMKQIQDMGGIAIAQLQKLILSGGDIRGITYVLDRILPKGRIVELDDARPSTIATMLANGELAPDEARDIAAAIKSLREIEDLEQLRAKLIELEAIVTDGAKR